MWDLPGPGIEPVSPSLASGFLTTAPPGKSLNQLYLNNIIFLKKQFQESDGGKMIEESWRYVSLPVKVVKLDQSSH